MQIPPSSGTLGPSADRPHTASVRGLSKEFMNFGELMMRCVGGLPEDGAVTGPDLRSVPGRDDREPGEASHPEVTPQSVDRELEGSAKESEAGVLDPLELALSKPSFGLTPPTPTARGGLLLDPLVGELVRAIAWGGDRRRGAARLELGGSRFAGASVVVHAEGRELTIELDAPRHLDGVELGERLRKRLESKGLVVRAVTLR